MTITITWEAVTAMCAAGVAICAMFSWFVKVTVRQVLREELKPFMLTSTGVQMEKRIGIVETNLQTLIADQILRNRATD